MNIFLHFVFQVMVATVRCEEIAEEKLRQITTDDVLNLTFPFLFSFRL